MKLKPKEYKDIPDKKKNEIKFTYEHDKAMKEATEEKLKKLKEITPVEYLNILNEETKTKLIGLCLNKNILDSYEDDDLTRYDDDSEESEEDLDEDDDDSEEEVFQGL